MKEIFRKAIIKSVSAEVKLLFVVSKFIEKFAAAKSKFRFKVNFNLDNIPNYLEEYILNKPKSYLFAVADEKNKEDFNGSNMAKRLSLLLSNNRSLFNKLVKSDYENNIINKEDLIQNADLVEKSKQELFYLFKFDYSALLKSNKNNTAIDKIFVNNTSYVKEIIDNNDLNTNIILSNINNNENISGDNYLINANQKNSSINNNNINNNIINNTLNNNEQNFIQNKNFIFLKKENSKLSIFSSYLSSFNTNHNTNNNNFDVNAQSKNLDNPFEQTHLINNNANFTENRKSVTNFFSAIDDTELNKKVNSNYNRNNNYNSVYNSNSLFYYTDSRHVYTSNATNANYNNTNLNFNTNNISNKTNYNHTNTPDYNNQNLIAIGLNLEYNKSPCNNRIIHTLSFFVKRKILIEKEKSVSDYFLFWKLVNRIITYSVKTIQNNCRMVLSRNKLKTNKITAANINKNLSFIFKKKNCAIKNNLAYCFYLFRRNAKLVSLFKSIVKIQSFFRGRIYNKCLIKTYLNTMKALFRKFILIREICFKSKVFLVMRRIDTIFCKALNENLTCLYAKYKHKKNILSQLTFAIQKQEPRNWETTLKSSIFQWKNNCLSQKLFERLLLHKLKIVRKHINKKNSIKNLTASLLSIETNCKKDLKIKCFKKWKENIFKIKLNAFKKIVKKFSLLSIKNNFKTKKAQILFIRFASKLQLYQFKPKLLLVKKGFEVKEFKKARYCLLGSLIEKEDNRAKALKAHFTIKYCKRLFREFFFKKLVFLQRYIKHYFRIVKKLNAKFFYTKITKVFNGRKQLITEWAYRKLIDFLVKFNNFIKIKELKRVLIVLNRRKVIKSLEEYLFDKFYAHKKLQNMFKLYFIKNIKNIMLYISYYRKLTFLMEFSSQNKTLGIYGFIKENIKNLKFSNVNKKMGFVHATTMRKI